MMHPADQIVTIMDRIYKYGMTTTSGGNLSIMDSDGVMWISPSGVDKGTLRREDIIKVMPNGDIVGPHKPSVEYPFHASIYKMRPDIKAVLHAHPPSLVAYSIAREIPNMSIIPTAKKVCGDIAIAEYAVPGSKKLGENISLWFGKGYSTVMLENHGVVIGADSLFDAFVKFETLDYTARLQIRASQIGTPKELSEKHYEIFKNKCLIDRETFLPEPPSSYEREVRRDMCKLIKRAYNNGLFASGLGNFSHKLPDGSIIITPYKKDRNLLEPEDLVKVVDGKIEQGKLASRSTDLHAEIYKNNPDINSVIIAYPPNIMAFAVTDCDFDARLIPESYIMLRDVQKYPFGSVFMQPKFMGKELTPSNPVAIVENDCVITTGTSLLNAFDRLEVMEYSAKSVIFTKSIGKIVPISEEQVQEINKDFNLV